MNEQPYTTPEEDPFNIRPLLLQPRRKRSSMLNKWIQDQQQVPNETTGDIHDLTSESSEFHSGTHTNPYLAYPDLAAGTTAKHPTSPHASALTLASFDLVEDDDIPLDVVPDVLYPPSTPTSTSPRGKLFGTPTSLKSLHISFRSGSPSPRHSHSSSSSRMSFLPIAARFASGSGKTPSKQHSRSSSLSTLDTTSTASPMTPTTPTSPTSTKWRPTVLGYFSTSQISIDPSESLYAPPRPSMSSSNTATSTTTSVTSPTITAKETPVTPSKMFGLRNRRHSQGNLLQSANFATISEGSDSGSCHLKSDVAKPSSARLPFAPKSASRLANANAPPPDFFDDDDEGEAAAVQTSKSSRAEMAFHSSGKSGSLPSRVALSALNTRNQKKKKLVISGVAPNDTRKFEGVKRWCETFGEVTHIVRNPNGELVVHFRRADVADTVCRLRAQVFIAGVGSVNLSWYTGRR